MTMNLDSLKAMALTIPPLLQSWLSSPQFYAQVIIIAAAWLFGRLATKQVSARIPLLQVEPTEGRFLKYQVLAYSCRSLLGPALLFLGLTIGAVVADASVGASWLVRICKSLALVYVLFAVINRFLTNPMVNGVARWVGLPVAAIYALGYFDTLTSTLDGIAFQAGNIRLSVLALLKAAVFGGILFWFGRTSATAGQKVIRDQQTVDIQTRELAAKALEIAVFCIVGLLLMNILGLDLTALAVFGGALGVGIGFGLQQIASNFISGIILLLERSLKLGDYIQLEDGRAGTLSQMNMRSSVLSTFDGKDIMVPNDKFITTSFTNWTNADPKQRYEVEFSVAYETDLHKVSPLIVAAVSAHQQVLQEPEAPDVELRGFGDNGVNFVVEFWVSGIDDGKNKFTSEVRFLIWDALKNAGISMPFPQREIRILGEAPPKPKKEKS